MKVALNYNYYKWIQKNRLSKLKSTDKILSLKLIYFLFDFFLVKNSQRKAKRSRKGAALSPERLSTRPCDQKRFPQKNGFCSV